MSEISGADWKWRAIPITDGPLLPVTRAMIDKAMMRQPSVGGDMFLVGRGTYAVMRITMRGLEEHWDRRRIKREARKGARSTYRGGPFKA